MLYAVLFKSINKQQLYKNYGYKIYNPFHENEITEYTVEDITIL